MSGADVFATIGDVAYEPVVQTGPKEGVDFTYIDIGSVDREAKVIVDAKTLSASEAPSRARQVLRADDVLVSMTRPNLNAVARVPASLDGAIGSTGFHVLRSQWMEPGFLHYLVQTANFVDAMCNVVQGALYPAVRPADIAKFSFRLPPRAEQTRIVEKLEELLGGLDTAVGELKAAQQKLTHYRQSLLKAAMEGALTEAWRSSPSPCPRSGQGEVGRGSLLPSDKSTPPQPSPSPSAKGREQETGTQLLHRILQERRARWEEKQRAKFAQTGKTPPKDWQAKYPEPAAPDTTDLPALPEGWVWASVEQLGEVTTGFTPSTSNAAFFGGTIPFFKPSDLDAGYDLREYRESLTELGAAQGRMLPAKSILVTCIGATIGKTALARVACTTNQQINSISVSSNSILPEYVYFVMVSNFGQRQIIDNASATTLPILNKSKFEKLLVPLPPHAEQVAIIDSLETALFAIKEQETAITHSLHQAAAQRRNLLRAAFSGQLVPQDPNDEPASELLARIRAAKADNVGRKRAARKTK